MQKADGTEGLLDQREMTGNEEKQAGCIVVQEVYTHTHTHTQLNGSVLWDIVIA